MKVNSIVFNIKGELKTIKTPCIIGIINLSPNSFFDGGKIKSDKSILKYVEKHIKYGCQIIDIGACSTAPKSKIVSENVELSKVVNSIILIKKSFPDILISIDSFRARVVKEAVGVGADIINDVSGGNFDNMMFYSVSELKVPYILNHSLADSYNNIHSIKDYNEDITSSVIKNLIEKIDLLHSLNIHDVIVDPSFGFGKTLEQNYEILKNINHIKTLEKPILAGVSRKSMIYKPLDTTPKGALNGTSVIHYYLLQNGIDFLRVHDSKEANQVIKINNLINS